MPKREKFLWGLCGLAVIYIYLWIFLNFSAIQRDFPVYWAAVRAWVAGLNPYVLENLAGFLPQRHELPYTYTPLPLFFFLPLSLLPYSLASVVFFLVKILAGLTLFAVWLKYWIKTDRAHFVIFALAAYNKAIWGDLVAGNVVLVEQLLLWLGLSLFLLNRFFAYALLVVAASVFKFVPVLWAGILLFTRSFRGISCAVFAIGVSLLLHAASFWITGFTLQDWLGSILWDHGGGRANPALAALLKDLAHFYGLPSPQIIHRFFSVLIAGFTLWAWGKWFRSDDKKLARHLLLFSCLSYSLVLPEFKGYSYILLIVPTWFCWTDLKQWNPLWLTVAFLVLETAVPLDAYLPWGLLWNYSPLFVALFAWISFARFFRQLSRGSACDSA